MAAARNSRFRSVFRPTLTALESREVPAGNIQVAVINGVLTIRSDDDFHAFDISGCSDRSVMIRPAVGTTINGQDQPAWFGNIDRGFDIETGNGADSIVINNVNCQDFLSIRTGGGDDVVHLVNGTRSPDSTWVITGDGDDMLVASDTFHGTHFAFLGGAGNDRAIVERSVFGRQTSMDGGDGTDGIQLTATNFSGATSFEESTADMFTKPGGNTNSTPTDGDTTGPTVSLSSTSASSTNAAFTVTATFSETVSGFTIDDVSASNGTISGFAATDGSTYTFTVTPTAEGAVNVSVVAAAATDAAGNASAASAPLTRTYDITAPAIAVTALQTNVSTPTITGTVDADATSVTVTVNGQQVTGTISGTSWTATLTTALTDGTYTASVTAVDAAGNSGNGSGTVTIDTTAPTATLSTTAADGTDVSPIPFTLTFSEAVTNLSQSGISVTNGSISNFTTVNESTYTFDVIPTLDGDVSVSVASGTARDLAGNPNTISEAVSLTFTGAVPTVAFSAAARTNASPITVTATFSEDVTGFEEGDLVLTNATLSNFVAGENRTWTFDLTPLAEGDVIVSLPAGAVVDSDNRDNTAATVTLVYDITPATGTITAATRNTSTLSGTVSEAGSTVSVTVDGQTVNAIVTGTDWTVTFPSSLADGTYDASIAITDAAGNTSSAELADALTIDTVAPTVSLAADPASPTSAASTLVTVTLGDGDTLDAADVTVTGGSLSNFQTAGDGTATFTLTPDADGTVSVSVAAGAIVDAAGNTNAAASLSVIFDRTAPTAAINANSAEAITGTVSDAKTGVASVEVSISDGSLYWDGTAFLATDETFLAATVEGGATWSYAITTPGTYTVRVRSTDAAGNVSTASGSAIVSALTLNDDTGMVDTIPDIAAADWMTSANGLKVWDTVVGSGATAGSSSTLSVYYTGWTLDGVSFDSARDTPASFNLAGLIEGWQEGLPGMKVGGIRRLYIPSELAYGSSGSGSIPGDADLVFEIKLVAAS